MRYTEIKDQGAVAAKVYANTLLLVCETPETDPQSKVITGEGLANSFNQPGTANTLALMQANTPVSSLATAKRGIMFFDNDYLYIAVDTDTIKRIPLEAF